MLGIARRRGWMMVWQLILSAFGGATVAFGLREFKDRFDKTKRVRGYKGGLQAEIRECTRIAGVYPGAGVASPLYRLPTLIYPQALPGLLSDGALNQSAALLLFYVEVETANRGLDRADLLSRQMNEEAVRIFEDGLDQRVAPGAAGEGLDQAKALRREEGRIKQPRGRAGGCQLHRQQALA